MTARGAGLRGAALGVVLAAACGGAKPRGPAKLPPVHLEIMSGKDTNHGGPLYVVVRKVDRAGFLAEDYDAIADRLFAEPRDPAVLRKAIVRPGDVLRLDAERDLADGEVLGIYFLFSLPDDQWRLALLDPKMGRVAILLGASGIVSAVQR